jgi:hypothetical protein
MVSRADDRRQGRSSTCGGSACVCSHVDLVRYAAAAAAEPGRIDPVADRHHGPAQHDVGRPVRARGVAGPAASHGDPVDRPRPRAVDVPLGPGSISHADRSGAVADGIPRQNAGHRVHHGMGRSRWEVARGCSGRSSEQKHHASNDDSPHCTPSVSRRWLSCRDSTRRSGVQATDAGDDGSITRR